MSPTENKSSFRPRFSYRAWLLFIALIGIGILGVHQLSYYAQKKIKDDDVRAALIDLNEQLSVHLTSMRQDYPKAWSIERVCEQRHIEENMPAKTDRIFSKAYKLTTLLDSAMAYHPSFIHPDLPNRFDFHWPVSCDAPSMRFFDEAIRAIGNEYEVEVPSLDLKGLAPLPNATPVLVSAPHPWSPLIRAYPHQKGVLLILSLFESGSHWTGAQHYRMTLSYEGKAGEREKLEHPGKGKYFQSFAIDKNATLYATGRGHKGRGILGRFGADLTLYSGDIGYTEFVTSTQNGVEVEIDEVCHVVDDALKLTSLAKCGRPQYPYEYSAEWREAPSTPLTNGDTVTVREKGGWVSVQGQSAGGGDAWWRKVVALNPHEQHRLTGAFLSANGHMVVTTYHPKDNQFAIYLSKDSGRTWFHRPAAATP